MDDRVLLAEGREAEVYIQSDGTVLKLMRNAVDIARAQREAAVCRLLEQQGHVAPTVHDVVTVGDRPGLVIDRIEGEDLLAALQRRPLQGAHRGAGPRRGARWYPRPYSASAAA